MFFIVSKILSFLTTPLFWIISLLILSVIIKQAHKKKIFLWSSLICLLVFTNPYIFGFFSKMWQTESVTKQNMGQYDIGVVLSGMIAYDEDIDRVLFNSNVNRITQAVELYKNGSIKKIFISGGSGSITYPEKSEAAILKRYLINYFGIPQDDIFTETLSNNTHENAKYTLQKLKELGLSNSKILLITSDLHMRRAKGCFKKVGLKTDLYSAGRSNSREQFIPSKLIMPQAEVLFYWNSFFHELIGVITYKLTGYI